MPPSAIKPLSSWAKPEPATILTAQIPVLLPTDTCDRCGPAVLANCAVRLLSGSVLTFCLHCYNVHAPGLLPVTASFVQNAVE